MRNDSFFYFTKKLLQISKQKTENTIEEMGKHNEKAIHSKKYTNNIVISVIVNRDSMLRDIYGNDY